MAALYPTPYQCHNRAFPSIHGEQSFITQSTLNLCHKRRGIEKKNKGGERGGLGRWPVQHRAEGDMSCPIRFPIEKFIDIRNPFIELGRQSRWLVPAIPPSLDIPSACG